MIRSGKSRGKHSMARTRKFCSSKPPKFLTPFATPSGSSGTSNVYTLSVGAQWVTSSKIDTDLIYEITKALWSDKTRAALDAGHAKGKAIRKETALLGLGIPLHAGAEKFYKEAGLAK